MRTLFLLLIIPILSCGQLFTIENDYMDLYNLSTIDNFSENTYVYTLDAVNISWEIIVDSMPSAWDFQHCFPECHPINTYIIDPISFPIDSNIFLKGHFYPNNIPGEGLLMLELNANHGGYLDTVTWRGTAMLETTLQEHINNSTEIKYMTNLAGQQINNIDSENIIIITYKNYQSITYYMLR